jgi:vacuolar protein sorting-associated protein 54
VETYLVREIAARYDSFFDASAHVQDLGASVYRLHQQVAEMRGRVAGLEREAGQGVVVAGSLRRQQANMLATLETLKAVEGVAHAQAALQAIMADATGVAVDFAAAIDVLEVLQGALDSRELLGLRCFKGLPAQIAASMQAIDDLMAADFLERTRFGGRGACLAAVSDRLRAQLAPGGAAEGEAPPGSNVQRAAQLRLRDAAATAEAGALLEAEWALRESVEDVLLPLAAGLQRMGRLGAAMRALQDASVQQLRDFIGRVVSLVCGAFRVYRSPPSLPRRARPNQTRSRRLAPSAPSCAPAGTWWTTASTASACTPRMRCTCLRGGRPPARRTASPS